MKSYGGADVGENVEDGLYQVPPLRIPAIERNYHRTSTLELLSDPVPWRSSVATTHDYS